MTSPTRAQFATAVDAAHDALHDAADLMPAFLIEHPCGQAIERAHEHLHTVGAGSERVQECGTGDPELQAAVAHFIAATNTTILPGCGHRFSDLISASGTVTKRGACLAALYPRQP